MKNRCNEHPRCLVDYTCSYIDAAIKAAEDCIGVEMGADDAYLIVQQLEELRELHDDLRNWGCEEAREVDTLQVEVIKLKRNIDTLTR